MGDARPLEGRVAFITGAGRAQGRAIAARLAADGADVIAIDVAAPVETANYPMATPEDLEETARLVASHGREAITAAVDVRDPKAIARTLGEGMDRFGRLDIVCANAGIAGYGRAEDLDDAQWGTMIDINLTGVFNTAREAIPHLRAGGRGGSLILTSSVYGIKSAMHMAHYSAAKHGVIGLMKVLALELAEDRIRANCLLPGAVRTGILDNLESRKIFYPDRDPETVSLDDMARILDPMSPLPVPWVEPEEIADAVAWLVSDSARHVTGVALPVDMGMLAT